MSDRVRSVASSDAKLVRGRVGVTRLRNADLLLLLLLLLLRRAGEAAIVVPLLPPLLLLLLLLGDRGRDAGRPESVNQVAVVQPVADLIDGSLPHRMI